MVSIDTHTLIGRSAISGIIWAGIAIVVVMVLGGPGASLDRIAWAYRGGVLAAPFIGIAVGFSSGMFRRAGFAGRASVAIITLYVATFLFLLAARGFAFAAGEMRHVSLTNIIFDCWNATIAGLTWSGFVVVLAPLAYVTHLLVSRSDFFAPPQASAAR